ncbi:CNNM domain-containing protein [Williamsia sp. CHRR-6]|uniref:CNNM domain-containing protein n=1 Tax=Williamsia sp. CHRR-6 TaxID=2835871 RepID=UPI001BDB324F|nr:CNNM domain-containing protein [Williamsia sp. CHRR-6]MBT0567789.1 DUF21 domain-containing protein [Williamsia sp. CHRR-6]
MSNPLVVVVVTIGLIAASAFFVAAEFAVIAARTHRLADEASSNRAARAALRNATDLSLLLAGAQLGITVCTLALGAVTKPAVHYSLTPLLTDVGLPKTLADVVAFLLALFVVTFLHLVVGEMAPKSWAIAYPERGAKLLALPMRGFLIITGPLLRGLNALANRMVVACGVTPVDETSASQTIAGLRQLIEHSSRAGTLDDGRRDRLLQALSVHTLTVGDLLDRRRGTRGTELATVAVTDPPAEIRRVAQESGHLRLPVVSASRIVGFVHARDALGPNVTSASEVMRPILQVAPTDAVLEVLARMQTSQIHIAVVAADAHRSRAVLTLADVAATLRPTAVTA